MVEDANHVPLCNSHVSWITTTTYIPSSTTPYPISCIPHHPSATSFSHTLFPRDTYSLYTYSNEPSELQFYVVTPSKSCYLHLTRSVVFADLSGCSASEHLYVSKWMLRTASTRYELLIAYAWCSPHTASSFNFSMPTMSRRESRCHMTCQNQWQINTT